MPSGSRKASDDGPVRGLMIGAYGARLLVPLVLAAAAATAPAAADPAQPDSAALDRAIHDYLVRHPEAVLDALKAAQQKADATAAERVRRIILARKAEIFHDADDLVQGNPKGDVTLVEFFDYRCPYCKAIEPSLDALLQEDRGLRIVYKEFPVLGEASVFATHVALAARKQGKYAAFHRAMMAAKGDITDAIVMQVAASVGLDLAKIKADMGSAAIDRIINANYALADALDVEGTPAIIIGDTLIPGAADIDSLRKDIAAARKGDS